MSDSERYRPAKLPDNSRPLWRTEGSEASARSTRTRPTMTLMVSRRVPPGSTAWPAAVRGSLADTY